MKNWPKFQVHIIICYQVNQSFKQSYVDFSQFLTNYIYSFIFRVKSLYFRNMKMKYLKNEKIFLTIGNKRKSLTQVAYKKQTVTSLLFYKKPVHTKVSITFYEILQ